MNGRENYYIIKRAALWLAPGHSVVQSEVLRWFTPEAIASLIKNDYIELVTSIEVEQDCEIQFNPCSECNCPDACEDFGCAISAGITEANEVL